MRDEIRLLCSGTATPASSLVPKGLALVDRLRGVDSDFGYQFWQVSDTQSIEVRINGGNATVKIFDADEQGDGGVCPPYQSGMLQRCRQVSRTNPETGAPMTGLWAFKPSAAYASVNKLTREWQVGKYGAVDSQITPDPGGGVAGIPVPIPWSSGGLAQTASIKPGLYSGRMRQVVQVLLGSDTPVTYGFGFALTHGVIPHSKGDWLAEISAGGIRVMRLPSCKASVPAANTLGYVPTGKGFPTGDALTKAIAAGSVRTLMSASGMTEPYKRQPFSPLFGWAFSYDGTRASAVVKGYASPDDNYLTTWLYTVTFTMGADGPASASVAMIEKGQVINAGFAPISRYAKGVFKVPLTPSGLSVPMDFGPREGWESYEPGNCNAPIHVWYKPSGERAMVRYRNSVIEARRPTDEKRRFSYARDDDEYFDLPDESWASLDRNMGEEFVEYPDPSSMLGNYTEQANQQIYITTGPMPEKERFTPRRKTYTANASQDFVYELGFSGGASQLADMTAWKLVRVTSESAANRSNSLFTGVIIPTHEREAAIYGEADTISVASKDKAFQTWRARGVRGAYRRVFKDPPHVYRSDSMPMDFSYVDSGEFPLSTSGDCGFELTVNNTETGFRPGGFIKGNFGGFSGKFGPSELPAAFTTPFGFETGDTTISAVQPCDGYEIHYNTFDRKVKKVLVCHAGQINLDKNYGTAPDEFSNSPTARYLPDSAFFSDSIVGYPLIQSWNGLLRYSPPKIGALEYTKSNFGDYGDPHVEAKSTINFVGDA